MNVVGTILVYKGQTGTILAKDESEVLERINSINYIWKDKTKTQIILKLTQSPKLK